jgi:hypothetical protein
MHFSHLALPPKEPDSEDTVFDFVVGSDGDYKFIHSMFESFIVP